MSEIICPKCSSNKCVHGVMESSDPDFSFEGAFYPLYIKKKTFFTIRMPKVKIKYPQKFFGCYNCGHLWSTLDLDKFRKVIEKAEWKGGEQIEPPPEKSYFWYISFLIFAALAGSAIFFKYNT